MKWSSALQSKEVVPKSQLYSSSSLKSTSQIEAVTEFESTLANIKVFPNPATDKISLSDVSANSAITILNVYGQTVLKTQSLSDAGEFEINISKLDSGAYMVVVENGNREVFKFIKR